MRKYLGSILVPPVGVFRYGCGSSCAAPVTVLWLFGLVSVVLGFFGGPTGEPGIDWQSIIVGLGMWAISAGWTTFAMHGTQTDKCDGARRG